MLSHTNVAVNEIKNRLSDYADRLLSYPNYIGTIQSFIDRFVTMPYLRNVSGQNVQVVDSLTYAQHMLSKIQHEAKYKALDYVTRNNFETGGQFSDRINHTQALYIRDDGALCIGRQQKPLAGAGKASAEQYKKLLVELLENEGMIRYQDAYVYASTAIGELPAEYADLFSSRFQYVLEPGKLARTAEIDASLAGMQKVVGGLIEPFYPFEEQVCIVCNEESKINGMRPNRSVKNDDGVMVDFIFGPAFICDCRGENLDSLSDEQIDRYGKMFRYPEHLARVNDTLLGIPYRPQPERER